MNQLWRKHFNRHRKTFATCRRTWLSAVMEFLFSSIKMYAWKFLPWVYVWRWMREKHQNSILPFSIPPLRSSKSISWYSYGIQNANFANRTPSLKNLVYVNRKNHMWETLFECICTRVQCWDNDGAWQFVINGEKSFLVARRSGQ